MEILHSFSMFTYKTIPHLQPHSTHHGTTHPFQPILASQHGAARAAPPAGISPKIMWQNVANPINNNN
jgi:hypothetical protein